MSIPKYQQIKQNLLYEINNGKFQPGDKFYSEAELKRKYNVILFSSPAPQFLS